MRRAFAGLATLLALAIVVQFYLAASGAFNTAPNEESFSAHRALGYPIFAIAALMTILAAVARLPGRLIGLSGLIAGLFTLQVVIAVIAEAFDGTGDASTTAGQLIFGLHAVNGLLILAVAGAVARQAWALSRSTLTHRPAGAGLER